MNVPAASHMNGIWERQIRTTRSILQTLLHEIGTQLDDEALRTLMYETANIVYSRPLTTENLDDPTSPTTLTPNHILTKKSDVTLTPPRTFVKEDIYLRKKWKRAQCILNLFWSRFRKEYLQGLQHGQK